MSWDEFGVYRTQNTINKTQSASVEIAKPKIINPKAEVRELGSNLPAKIGEEAVATAAPVKDIFVDEAKYVRTVKSKTQNTINKTQRVDDIMQETDNKKQKNSEVKAWTREDNKSLLEDSADEAMKIKAVNVLPDKRGDLYDLFVKEIRFPVKDEMRGRLNSLVVSFVKGVRNEEQMRGYLQRNEAEGGLGFSEEQTAAVIAAIKKIWHLANTPPLREPEGSLEPRRPTPLRDGSSKIPSSEEGDGGVRIHSQTFSVSPAGGSDGVANKLPPRRRAGEVLGINTKPLVQDVVPPKVEPAEKVSLGPIDEIATMTLTDFRRLATGGIDSIQVLRGKFSALRKESVIIYLQALDAWFSSPVYKDYQNLIKRAVNERRKLTEVVGESGIKFEEFERIAEVGKTI
ncbi:MAG: hypothetical protein A2921_03240 [Candidatus Magasanikbacteria bacterium RIFCSPLOWO2_01_FULL_43_20b]|nr:MAG: hypothetical protein A3C74_04360 [Candidatus Magasanikbacteria bacterium RIFCSPHIGHO2_02_FULL_44_13]OGH71598.1 MAG: hypothetical protein A3I93_03185 [Candidatus Magasanikbacteria bacterium RIFCSPLOWO2_02_FULL_43_22]OGH72802.1 MAG: hypothetical protein A2921_03240 [Candidatus Magasanikbacteria bacterium RIFCSPLOWO2_01_FULL_43_20b]